MFLFLDFLKKFSFNLFANGALERKFNQVKNKMKEKNNASQGKRRQREIKCESC